MQVILTYTVLLLSLIPFTIGGEVEGLISNQLCSYDADCKENSFCFNNTGSNRGRCRCKPNFITEKSNYLYECLEIPNYTNGYCKRDIQCQFIMGTGAKCSGDNQCQCAADHHLAKNNKCYNNTDLGGVCQENHNCLLDDGTYASCALGKCECPSGYKASPNKRNCILYTPLGEICTDTGSCPDYAKCFGVCKCMAGYVESADTRFCLKAADVFGDNCTENLQCTEYLKYSFCQSGKCVCEPGFHGYGNECVKNARLNQPCTSDKECKIAPDLEKVVQCKEGICKCVIGVSDDNQYGCLIPGASTKTFLGCVMSLIIVAPLLFI